MVTEGTGEIVVDGKVSHVGPDGVKSTGNSPLLFYYFQWKA